MDESIPGNISKKYLGELMPQEEVLEKSFDHKSTSIGIPKEASSFENRVALNPDAASILIRNGLNVIVETGAGISAGYPDIDYSEKGCTIVNSPREAFQHDITLKIAPPTLHEITYIPRGKTIISAINLPTQDRKYFELLAQKKLTALAFEYMQDNHNSFPVVRTLSEIIGNTTLFIAAEYLAHPELGRGILLGGFPGISPSEIVIIGAGTVGEYAARTAASLGAMVKVFDSSISKLRRIQEKLGSHIYTSVLENKPLETALKNADAVIAAKYVPHGTTPCLIPEEMVKNMQKGAIIIDVSIDQGGCFETSHPTNIHQPIFQKHNVTHYCVPNISSGVPHTASKALSHIFAPVLLKFHNKGGVLSCLKNDYWLCKGVYSLSGTITNKFIGEYFNMPYQDIDLLMAAYH